MDGWMGRPKDIAPLVLDSGFWKGRGRRDVFVGVGSEAGGCFCVLRFGVGERCCLPWYVRIAVDEWVDDLGIMLSASSSL